MEGSLVAEAAVVAVVRGENHLIHVSKRMVSQDAKQSFRGAIKGDQHVGQHKVSKRFL